MTERSNIPGPRRGLRESGPSLKPYLAVVTLLVVVGVVSFSLVDRWLAEPPPESDSDSPIGGGGKVVIGQSARDSSASRPEPGAAGADSTFKPQEFTFYKSLGNGGQAPPALEPKPQSEARASKPAPPTTRAESARPVVRKSYTVQIGSFQDRKSADRLAAKVRHYRYTVSVTRVVLPDTGVRYRVRMGSFSTREDALKLAETLKKREKKLEPFVALNLPASG
jgi:cell division septation protein DedD